MGSDPVSPRPRPEARNMPPPKWRAEARPWAEEVAFAQGLRDADDPAGAGAERAFGAAAESGVRVSGVTPSFTPGAEASENEGRQACPLLPSAPPLPTPRRRRGEPYLDSVLKPGAGPQVPAEGTGEHGVLPRPGFHVSQALEEVAWGDRERLGTPGNPPGPASQAVACAAPWEASAGQQSQPPMGRAQASAGGPGWKVGEGTRVTGTGGLGDPTELNSSVLRI